MGKNSSPDLYCEQRRRHSRGACRLLSFSRNGSDTKTGVNARSGYTFVVLHDMIRSTVTKQNVAHLKHELRAVNSRCSACYAHSCYLTMFKKYTPINSLAVRAGKSMIGSLSLKLSLRMIQHARILSGQRLARTYSMQISLSRRQPMESIMQMNGSSASRSRRSKSLDRGIKAG